MIVQITAALAGGAGCGRRHHGHRRGPQSRAARMDATCRCIPTVAKTPFVSRGAARAAITSGATYTGERIVAPSARDDLGVAASRPGSPVLADGPGRATRVVGSRGRVSVRDPRPRHRSRRRAARHRRSAEPTRSCRCARAPPRTPITPTPTTVLWPFLLPGERAVRQQLRRHRRTGCIHRPQGPDAQSARPRADHTAARFGRHPRSEPAAGPRGDERRAGRVRRRRGSAQRSRIEFLDDLTDLADDYSCATVGYDRPDVLAVAASPSAAELNTIIDAATAGTLDAARLWPACASSGLLPVASTARR